MRSKPITWYSYDRLKEKDKLKYDNAMCMGKQRRCEVCTKTFTWKEKLPPEDVYNMALSVHILARKLCCSWWCYFKLVGKFIRKAEKNPEYVFRPNIKGSVCYFNFLHGIADDDALNWNIAFIKQDKQTEG